MATRSSCSHLLWLLLVLNTQCKTLSSTPSNSSPSIEGNILTAASVITTNNNKQNIINENLLQGDINREGKIFTEAKFPKPTVGHRQSLHDSLDQQIISDKSTLRNNDQIARESPKDNSHTDFKSIRTHKNPNVWEKPYNSKGKGTAAFSDTHLVMKKSASGPGIGSFNDQTDYNHIIPDSDIKDLDTLGYQKQLSAGRDGYINDQNKGYEKRYLDHIDNALIKKNTLVNKRYLDDLGSSFVKKNTIANKRYLDDLGSSFVKKNYIDDLGSSFVKKNYIDDLGSSFVKKNYIDDLGSSFVKKNTIAEKRYLDDLGSSFVKKNYIDDLGSSFVKKSYLDDIGSSFVKKNANNEKRYLDDLGSSFVKKDSNTEKRYLDDLGSSFVKKDKDGHKRYLDDLGSSFVKKDKDGHKRYLDDLGSSFVKKKDNSEKRYLDDLRSSFVKKNDNAEKRYLDDLGSSFVKKNSNNDKRYLDDLGSAFVKKKSNTDKRYLDDLGSAFVKRKYLNNHDGAKDLQQQHPMKSINPQGENALKQKRYLDDIGRSFVKKNALKRYIKELTLLMKRNSQHYNSYKLFSSHPYAIVGHSYQGDTRYGNHLPKDKFGNSNRDKRMMELTDDMLDGSRDVTQTGTPKSRKRRQAYGFHGNNNNNVHGSHHQPSFSPFKALTLNPPKYRPSQAEISSAVESLLNDIIFYDNFTSSNSDKQQPHQWNHHDNDAYPGFKTKRYLDDIEGSFMKRSSLTGLDNFEPGEKRYLDDVGSAAPFRKRNVFHFNHKINIPFDWNPILLDASRGSNDLDLGISGHSPNFPYDQHQPMRKRFSHFSGSGEGSPFRTFKPGHVTFQRFLTPPDSDTQRLNPRTANRLLLYRAPPTSTSRAWSNHPWSRRINDLPGKKTLRSTIPPETIPPTLMSAMLLPGASRRRHYGNTKNYIRSAMQKLIRVQGKSRARDVNYSIHNRGFRQNYKANHHDDEENDDGDDDDDNNDDNEEKSNGGLKMGNYPRGFDPFPQMKSDRNFGKNKYKYKNRLNDFPSSGGSSRATSSDIHGEFSGRYNVNGYSTYREKTKVDSAPTHDYFDSLAGSLLQT